MAGRPITRFYAKIAAGQSLSAPVEIGGRTLIGYRLPPGFEGTLITFVASLDGVVDDELFDEAGFELAGSGGHATESRLCGTDAFRNELEVLRFCKSIRVRSGTKATPIVVAVERTITLLTEE